MCENLISINMYEGILETEDTIYFFKISSPYSKPVIKFNR